MKKKKKINKLVILKDTRESVSTIYHFKQQKFKDVQMIKIKLPCGDFSVMGEECNIFVERKTTSDLCGSFTHDRDRFERMWVRAIDLRVKHKYLLIEGDMKEVLSGDYRSAVVPQSLIGSLMSWSMKYGFNWFFVPNIKAGEETIYRLMLNYKRLKKEGVLK